MEAEISIDWLSKDFFTFIFSSRKESRSWFVERVVKSPFGCLFLFFLEVWNGFGEGNRTLHGGGMVRTSTGPTPAKTAF